MIEFLTFLIAIQAVIFSNFAVCEERPPSLQVTTTAKISTAKKVSIKFIVENTGPISLEILKSSLPNHRAVDFLKYEMEVVSAFEGENGESGCDELLENVYIDDAGFGVENVAPGEKIENTISLNFIYPNIGDIIGKCDVIFFWSYRPKIEGEIVADRVAGAIAISRSLTVSPASTVSIPLRNFPVKQK